MDKKPPETTDPTDAGHDRPEGGGSATTPDGRRPAAGRRGVRLPVALTEERRRVLELWAGARPPDDRSTENGSPDAPSPGGRPPEAAPSPGASDAGLALRARAILLLAEGFNDLEVSRRLTANVSTVARWRKRFVRGGPEALRRAPVGRLAERVPDLSDERRRTLEAWAAAGPDDGEDAVRLARRAKAILLEAAGESPVAVGGALGVSQPTLLKWRRLFIGGGLKALAGRDAGPRLRELRTSFAVSDDDRRTLEALAAAGTESAGKDAARVAVRAGAVLRAVTGADERAVAKEAGVSLDTLRWWRRNFQRRGPKGLVDVGRAAGALPPPPPPVLNPEGRRILEAWRRGEGGVVACMAKRAEAVLMAAAGRGLPEIARALKSQPGTVRGWLERFGRDGVDGLLDRRPRPRPPELSGDGGAPARLPEDHRAALERWSGGADPELAGRAAAVLALADGKDAAEVAAAAGTRRPTVRKWLRRVLTEGPEGIVDRRFDPEFRLAVPKPLSDGDRRILEAWAAGDDPGLADRARAVLWWASGKTVAEIGREMELYSTIPKRWLELFLEGGPERLAASRRVPRPKGPPELSDAARRGLELWAKGDDPTLAMMAKAVLMAAYGESDEEIALELGVSGEAAGRWRLIFVRSGTAGLAAAARWRDRLSAPAPELGAGRRKVLEGWAASAHPALARRAKAVLLAGEGRGHKEIARALGVTVDSAWSWLRLYRTFGPDGLKRRRGGRGRGATRIDGAPGGFPLDGDRRRILEGWAAGPDPRLALRAKAVLRSADGLGALSIARELGVGKRTVNGTRSVFLAGGIEALKAMPRPSRRGAWWASDDERGILGGWASGPDPELARKASAVLLAGRGVAEAGIAGRLGVRKGTVKRWLRAFESGGRQALASSRPGRERRSPAAADAPGRADPDRADPGRRRRTGKAPAEPAGPRPPSPAARHQLGPLDPPVPRPTDPQRRQLEAWAGGSDPALALRAKGVLVASAGRPPAIVADYLSDEGEGEVSPSQVIRWLERFRFMGPRGLEDPGGPDGPDGPDRPERSGGGPPPGGGPAKGGGGG